jgi:hypothetical protein
MASCISPGLDKKRIAAASVKAEYFKAMYRGCLDYLGPADIARVFATGPDGVKMSLSPRTLLQSIWNEKGSLPLDTLLFFLDNLEGVLSDNGIRPERFMLDTVVRINHGSMISPPSVLVFFAPYLTKILKMNIRELFLDAIVPLNKMIFSGIRTAIVKKETNGNYLEYVVMTQIPSASGKKVNGSAWLKPLFQSLGVGFGLPAMEEVSVLAETVSMDDMKSSGKIDAGILHEFNASSTTVQFCDLLAKHNVSAPAGYEYNDREVKLCACTIYDKKTGREIAAQGCAYGAPFHLFKIRAFKKYARGKFTMVKFITKAVGAEASDNAKFEERHGHVMGLFEGSEEFSFCNKKSRLFLNDRIVCGGIPARILIAMLTAFQDKGKREFTKGDFALDTRIVKNKLDKSFNLYIMRAMRHAQSAIPFLTITRHIGTGKIVLNATGEYRVKPH